MNLEKDIHLTPGILGIIYRNYYRNPKKDVIVVGNENVTYEELIDKGTKAASALYEMGIRSGDRVGILVPNSVNWYIFMFAIVRLGAIVVPFDPQMGEFEIRYLFDKIGIRTVLVSTSYRGLNHSEIIDGIKNDLPDIKSVIIDGDHKEDGFHKKFDSLLQNEITKLPNLSVNEESSNVFFATTGSTGNPKIVDIPCRIINNNIEKNSTRWGFENGDKFLLSMPLYHFAGFGWGLSCLSSGGTIYYEEDFHPTTYLEKIESEKLTKMLLTPTIAKIMLSHPKFSNFNIASLKEIIFTGEYLSDELASLFIYEYKMRVINALGMTETFVYLDWDSIRDEGISANYLGGIPGIGIKVVDDNGMTLENGETGLIHIKNSVMKQYFRLKDITDKTIDKEGWLNSGDLATIIDGRIKFSGRKKRVIKRGGNLVSPEEIEQFLRTHPACEAVIVDSEPDAIIGEKIVAYVQSSKILNKDELRLFCKGKISSYKIPDDFHFIKEVPKTVGKVNPVLLKKLLETELIKP